MMKHIMGFIKMKYQQFIIRLADKANIGDIIRIDVEEEVEKLRDENNDLKDDIHELENKISAMEYHLLDLSERNEYLSKQLYEYEPWESEENDENTVDWLDLI